MTQKAKNADLWALLGSEMRRLREECRLSTRSLSARIQWDFSYLAKCERGRKPPEQLVAAIDEELQAKGHLEGLYKQILKLSEQADTRGQVAASVANWDLTVANQVATVAATDNAAPSWTGQDDMIAVPGWADDGTELGMVNVPRSTFIKGGLGAAAAGMVGTPPAAASVDIPDGISPAEHYRGIKIRLMHRDNLRGPSAAISDAQNHLTAMNSLVNRLSGDERAGLLEVRTQFADLAGWLYQDAGHENGASYWLSQSIEWSHYVDPQVTSFMLARRSQMLAESGDGQGALDSALAAVKLAQPGSRIAAVAHTFLAHAHAMLGESRHSSAAYETATTTMENMQENGPGAAYALFFCPAYLWAYQARSLASLKDYAGSAEKFSSALAELAPGMYRDRGLYTAWMAQSLAHSGDHSQAVQRGMEALAIAGGTGSARITTELHQLSEQLPSGSEATQFRTALKDLEERN